MNELMPYGAYHVGASPERRAVLRKQALEKLIEEELQYQEAARVGLVAPKAEVDKEYSRVRRHYGSEEEFVAALKHAGSSKAEVRAEARRRALIRQAADRATSSKCRITEAEAREYYEANTTRFRMPEQLHVFTLTLGVEPSAPREQWDATRKRAEGLLAQARGGADFSALAFKYSTDPNKANGGDLGFVHRGRLSEEFEKALADAKPGALVGPIETIYGFHLLRLAEVRPPVQRTYAEVRVGLLKDLEQKRCAEVREAWLSGLRQRAEIVFADSGSKGPDRAIPKSPGR
jgi:parvulin-like peptidyl-prolyl isomerase